jgi:hypothetical protein
MASYLPPTETLAIFDPSVFRDAGEEGLTYDTASKYFLKYPNAQGTENLLTTNVNGTLTCNSNAVFNVIPTSTAPQPLSTDNSTKIPTTAWVQGAITGGSLLGLNNTWTGTNDFTNTTTMDKPLTMTGTLNTDRIINNVYYQLQDANSLATTTGQIYASSGIFTYDNDANGGIHNFATSDAGGVQTIPFSFSSTDLTIATINPPTCSASSTISTSDDSNKLPSTAWVRDYVATIPAPATPNLSAVLVAGNSAGSTAINMNNQNISAVNTLSFATTSQNSAYTGGTPGSYTNTNMTIDANGRITAISNGSAGTTPFVPKFHNFSDYQTGTSGYSQGPYINWSSGWGALDYVIIRVRAQVNWSITSGEYNNYASTAGELILRPHYATSGVIGSLSSPNIFWSTNSGSVVGNIKKLMYYTGATNNGSQGYFFVYGNGGSGGGASGSIQLMCDAPGSAGGWQYTCSYEYIIHSTSGASITFTNGPGGGSSTNNNLT